MYRIIKKIVIIMSLLLLVFSTGSPMLSYAAQNVAVNTVEGLIENVSDDTIVVRNRRYTITGVPLVKPSGKAAKNDDLKRGKKVEIFFQNKTMSSILIHNDVVE
jgi:hypothetical protein